MKYYTTPEEQFACWYKHYTTMAEIDDYLDDLAMYEEINSTELWLCVVAQELV